MSTLCRHKGGLITLQTLNSAKLLFQRLCLLIGRNLSIDVYPTGDFKFTFKWIILATSDVLLL